MKESNELYRIVQRMNGMNTSIIIYFRVQSMNVMSTTPMILPRNSLHSGGRSLLKPPEDMSASKGKTRKGGCRCGNATSCPGACVFSNGAFFHNKSNKKNFIMKMLNGLGKLTCCGQRCPCYVSRMACVDCKCKGKGMYNQAINCVNILIDFLAA